MNPVRSIFLLLLAACLALSFSAMAETDPPGRVARLALADGAVFLLDHDTREWSDAHVNWPVTTGDVLHSGADGRAELRIGSGAIRLDSGTEIELRQLDDEQIRIWLDYGSVALRVRSHDPADWITVDTRDGRVLATEPGQYRVDYADGTTTLTVHQGELGFFAEDSQTTVTDGQRIEVRYAQRTVYRSIAIVRDAFAHWYLARDSRDDALGQPRYVSAEMTGAEELARHGDWSHYADHGPVWTPHYVTSGWVPYRYGRWVWVRPWGWTWLDDAPWGFAPFHYGRWAMVRGRWAWIPGAYEARPVYAPALVAWLGSPGWRVGFSFGSAPAVGWFPLAPRELYVPYYRASRAHVHRLNVVHVTNVTHIHRRTDHSRRHWQDYRNHRHAATVIPASTLSQRRTVHRDAVLDSARWTRDVQIADGAPSRARQGRDPDRRALSLRLEGERERRRSGDDHVRRAANRSVTTLRESSDRPPRESQSVPRASEPQTRARPQARPAPSGVEGTIRSLREQQAAPSPQEQHIRVRSGRPESSVGMTPQRSSPRAGPEQRVPSQRIRAETTQPRQRMRESVDAQTPSQTQARPERAGRAAVAPDPPPRVEGRQDGRRVEGGQRTRTPAAGPTHRYGAQGEGAQGTGSRVETRDASDRIGGGGERRNWGRPGNIDRSS
ncbi:MAG TPA: FecR domain-containing protein [Rhodocyclaceae bacterium]|nr:FecR domain-containing protein [Rhodocyclaceae bacterium]HRQ46738.1 FecR domain-containing protein [Rhodocyclaceae bacterium]